MPANPDARLLATYARVSATMTYGAECLYVLNVLASHANSNGEAWPSIALIAELSAGQYGKVSVRHRLAELVAAGELVVVGKVARATRYRVCCLAPEPAESSSDRAPIEHLSSSDRAVIEHQSSTIEHEQSSLIGTELEQEEERDSLTLVSAPPAGRELGKLTDQVMQAFIDWRAGEGQGIAQSVRVRLRPQVRDALGSGIEVATVKLGLRDWNDLGKSPDSLAAFIDARSRGHSPADLQARRNGSNGHRQRDSKMDMVARVVASLDRTAAISGPDPPNMLPSAQPWNDPTIGALP